MNGAISNALSVVQQTATFATRRLMTEKKEEVLMWRIGMTTKRIRQIAIVAIYGVCMLGSGIAYGQNITDLDKREMNTSLDKTAQQLARLFSTPAFRGFLYTELHSARNTEHIIDLEQTIAKGKKMKGLSFPPGIHKKIVSLLTGMKTKLKNYAEIPSSLDLYFPVSEHFRTWEKNEHLVIAFAPLGNENEVMQITGYSTNNVAQVAMDATNAPSVPTLIVALEEHEAHTAEPPLKILSDPDKEDPDEKVDVDSIDKNSYLGIPKIKIYDDQEPWWKGHPEIYVVVFRTRNGVALGGEKIHLGKVNHEDIWYSLGDGPGYKLYFYFDPTYGRVNYYRVMEDDSWFGSGSITITINNVPITISLDLADDFLGSRNIDRNEIPWYGHHGRGMGKARVKVDKDP